MATYNKVASEAMMEIIEEIDLLARLVWTSFSIKSRSKLYVYSGKSFASPSLSFLSCEIGVIIIIMMIIPTI